MTTIINAIIIIVAMITTIAGYHALLLQHYKYYDFTRYTPVTILIKLKLTYIISPNVYYLVYVAIDTKYID